MQHQYRDPAALVTTDWLHEHLNDTNVRIFDCTMYLVADTDDSPYRVVSGEQDYRNGHIPGAVHIDLQRDLSRADAPFRFTLPTIKALQSKFAALGVGDDRRVVLYARGQLQWATRIWWMLRCAGFDNAAVLDGGWAQWCSADRPIATGEHRYPAASFNTRARPELFCDKDIVQQAAGEPGTCVINALSARLHAGQSARYGRAGRIPGSVNIAATALQHHESGQLLPAGEAAAMVAAAGVEPGRKVVIYCGGGIAATLDAFVLHQLGWDDITVYDNSLNEWAQDRELPMQTG